jgi:hypothetical protein
MLPGSRSGKPGRLRERSDLATTLQRPLAVTARVLLRRDPQVRMRCALAAHDGRVTRAPVHRGSAHADNASMPRAAGRGGIMNKDLLLLGANAPDMEVLRTRLVRIGYRVVPAKTPEQAHTFLRVAGTRIGAVIVPSDMPVMNLRGALDFMRRLSPTVPLAFLGAGREPGAEGRQRLRQAGIQIPIFDPLDLHTLRFQVNRALAAGRPMHRHRTTLRAPADWPVVAKSGVRQKEGRIYSISASGAFLSIAQPWMVKARVELRLAIPSGGAVTASGRVVMTNVPGNVMKRNLPFGMGVHFDQVNEHASVALLLYTQERSRALCI